MRESSTRYAVLGILAEGGPLTGYEIRARIAATLGHFWSESFGQLYPELARLAREGAVEEITEPGREGRPYRITPAGRDALAAWLVLPPAPERQRSALQLKLAFGRLMGTDHSRAFLTEAQEAAVARIEGLGVRRDGLRREAPGETQVFGLLALERSLAAAEAERDWAAKALKILDALEDGGPDAALNRLKR